MIKDESAGADGRVVCHTDTHQCPFEYHCDYCKIHACGENKTGWESCPHKSKRVMVLKELPK